MTKFAALVVALFWVVPMAVAQGRPATGQARLIAHGKYLVTRVAGCADCHSPHNERGEEIPGRALQGTLLDFQPLHPVPGWVAAAPPIAGLEGWTESEAVHFLMTGLDRSNKHPGPPMPPYRLSRHDAEAVAAYLKSLPPVK
jgi:mono/diheme cytochrome c family protein